MNNLQLTLIFLLAVSATATVPNTAGFEIGTVNNYKLLKKEGTSSLF